MENLRAGDETIDYYYNTSWQVLEVRKDGHTDPLDQYVWDIRYIDAPVLRWRDGNTDGDLDGGTEEGDNTLYYTNDANMNVTALVDESDGAVVERTMYDPYGKVSVRHGVRDSGGNDTSESEWDERTNDTSENEILYCGYRFDPETGLYHVRYRMCHPTLGRWMQRDPIGYADGMSLYEYARTGPVGGVDPFGLWTPGRHTTITGRAMEGHPAYLSRLDDDYKAAFIRGNVETDDASMFGKAKWAVKGFDAAEAEKHYMVGSDQEGQDSAERRQKARDRAEGRIRHKREKSEELFEWAKDLKARGEQQQGHRACIFAWETLGTSYHTFQDKFAHTDKDFNPLSSAEHGGTMSTSDPGFWSKVEPFTMLGYRMGKFVFKDVWNSDREDQATSMSRMLFGVDFETADGPKRCNCIEQVGG